MELPLDLLQEVHMGMYLSELIEQANKCLENIGLSSGTIDDYQCSAFRPIERRLGNSFITDSSIIQEQETHFLCLFVIYKSFIS